VKDYAEGTVSNNFALCIGQVSGFAGEAILDLFANDFCGHVSKRSTATRSTQDRAGDCSPPILKLEKAVGRFCDIVWLFRSVGDPAPTACYREYGGLALSSWWAERGAAEKEAAEGSKASRFGELRLLADGARCSVVWTVVRVEERWTVLF
jgi:hypothetical protein